MGRSAASLIPNKTESQVRDKAGKLKLRISPEAKYRIVHEAARTYMLANNPMKRPEVAAAMSHWAKTTEAGRALYDKMMEGHRKLQKDKPSKLEFRLRQILDELGIDYEPSFAVKKNLIVDIRIGNLIIQADGEYWHGHERFEPLTDRQIKQRKRDASQDACARSLGYLVERVWERNVTPENIRKILERHCLVEAQVVT